ncbi:MAG: hypothetical protein OQK12_13970 [Motiliproteus sp.]|nr:hypothetical protein [Motiliproteus sp.]MCW9053896.1 hypothetical protein [Motiliproteus sp.]
MNSYFELQYVVTQDRDAVRNSTTEYEYRVVDTLSQQVVMSFNGERHNDHRGCGASGTKSCLLIEEHGMVMTCDQTGNVQHHPLPTLVN